MTELGVHRAHQARSRDTERVIAETLLTMLREKPFPDITVAEIARRAGVSVGGFYGRYKSKEELLASVNLTILDEFAETAGKLLSTVGNTVGDIAMAYATLLVTNFRKRRAEILQILMYVQNNAASKVRIRQFNESVHNRMRELLREHATEHTINMALFFAGSAAREAILLQNIQMYPLALTDDELAREIAKAFERQINSDSTG